MGSSGGIGGVGFVLPRAHHIPAARPLATTMASSVMASLAI